MPDFNPNDVDALFREGAERHEFEYSPSSWTLMEGKLDKKESKRRILFYLLGFGILVSSIVIYSYIQFNKDFNNEVIASTTIENKSIEVDTEIKSIEKEKVEIPSINTVKSNIQQEIIKEYIPTDSKESSSNIGAQNSFQSENTGNLIGNEIVSIDSQNESLQNEQKIQNEVVVDNKIVLNTNSNLKQNETPLMNKNISIASLASKDFGLFDYGMRNLESIKLKPSQTSVIPITLTTSNRFALTVFANPEWSSVGLFEESKAGWSVGTKIGYQFANKVELSAGLAFSRKIYKGAGIEYTMKGGWFNDIEPMHMDAKCDVIEIPIALSYYVNGFRNSGFFADLGINSYMLHSEWYGFDYNDTLVRPDRYNEVIEEDENTHLVGVGRFAIGYQKVLSNNTSLQIAPYLQFPLTGIGAGRVNLYSTGVQIAVKFNTQ